MIQVCQPGPLVRMIKFNVRPEGLGGGEKVVGQEEGRSERKELGVDVLPPKIFWLITE